MEILVRSLVLKQIEEYRKAEQNFPANTMRWGDFFFAKDDGIVLFISQRAANKSNTGAIHISKTTHKDFNTLTDPQLLRALMLLTRQCGKQM